MKTNDFTRILDERGYAYRLEKRRVVVTFGGYVDLDSLTTLPKGVTFENGGSVDLSSLTTLPEGVTFKNGCNVYLRSLTTLPKGVTFENGGYVDLDSLTTLPKGVTFENGGGVYLDSLTTLPEGVTFENGRGVYLSRLTGAHLYQGAVREFRYVDSYTMIIDRSREQEGYKIHAARYLRGGSVNKLPRCFIAERDGLYAHGETVREAISDLQYKMAERADVAEVAAEICKTGTVTLAQFRAITGACREGIRAHLADRGIDLDKVDSLPLADALKAMDGTSYGDTFRKTVEDAE